MEILSLKTNLLNQNNYNTNNQTPEFIGSLITYPIDYTHPKCLPCDGFVLKCSDYEQLYSVIGKMYNSGDENEDEFRIPDYNITGQFLQPGKDVGKNIQAGLPNITGNFNSGRINETGVVSGAFYVSAQNTGFTSGGGNYGYYCSFDASRSSSIYGNSTTVQPPSKTVHICIRYK